MGYGTQRGDDGYFTTSDERLSTTTYAITSDEIDLRFENNYYYSSGSAWKVLWGGTTYTTLSGWRSGGAVSSARPNWKPE